MATLVGELMVQLHEIAAAVRQAICQNRNFNSPLNLAAVASYS